MLSHAHALVSLVWSRSTSIATAIAAFIAAGVIATVTAPALLKRPKTRALVTGRLPLVFLLFCLSDWGLLKMLPVLQLSFARNILPPLIATLFVRSGLFFGLAAAALVARWLKRRRPTQSQGTIILFIAANLAFSAAQVDAYVIEPLLVEVTEFELASGDLDPHAPPVRVVHLTDTHIERLSYRERSVIEKVNALEPDIIVMTGDYLNTAYFHDATAHQHFRQFVAQIEAPYGIYATRGTVEPSTDHMAHLIEDTGIVWLEQEAVTVNVRGQRVTLVGANCDHNAADAIRLEQAMDGIPDDAFTLLLFHSPDLIQEAAELGVDLYLGGHTHGGQLRLPFYGALVTMSKYGKRYEAGVYQEGDTTMVISRGIGFEGHGMPRARFLCPPEIVSVELGGAHQVRNRQMRAGKRSYERQALSIGPWYTTIAGVPAQITQSHKTSHMERDLCDILTLSDARAP